MEIPADPFNDPWPSVELPTLFSSPEALADHLRNSFRPGEVAALIAEVYERVDTKDSSSGPIAEEALDHELSAAFKVLPGLDIGYARELFMAFADSPVVRVRHGAAFDLWSLCAVDPDFGFTLLERLARDEARLVRGTIRTALEGFSGAAERRQYGEAAASLSALGLTWERGQQLLDALDDADSGERTFNLGEAALTRLIGPPIVKNIP